MKSLYFQYLVPQQLVPAVQMQRRPNRLPHMKFSSSATHSANVFTVLSHGLYLQVNVHASSQSFCRNCSLHLQIFVFKYFAPSSVISFSIYSSAHVYPSLSVWEFLTLKTITAPNGILSDHCGLLHTKLELVTFACSNLQTRGFRCMELMLPIVISLIRLCVGFWASLESCAN